MDDFILDKSEVRGKRSNKGQTKKSHERHTFDDDAHEQPRKQAGKRKHSRFYEQPEYQLEDEDFEDEPYADMIDPKMIK